MYRNPFRMHAKKEQPCSLGTEILQKMQNVSSTTIETLHYGNLNAVDS